MIPVQAIGVNDMVSVDGAAASADVDLRPTNHEIWIVHSLLMWHDDPAGLTILYQIYDGSSTYRLGTSGALAVSTFDWMYDRVVVQEPICLNYSHYIRLNGAGIAAGKKIYIRAFVTKLRGLPTDYGT